MFQYWAFEFSDLNLVCHIYLNIICGRDKLVPSDIVLIDVWCGYYGSEMLAKLHDYWVKERFICHQRVL